MATCLLRFDETPAEADRARFRFAPTATGPSDEGPLELTCAPALRLVAVGVLARALFAGGILPL